MVSSVVLSGSSVQNAGKVKPLAKTAAADPFANTTLIPRSKLYYKVENDMPSGFDVKGSSRQVAVGTTWTGKPFNGHYVVYDDLNSYKKGLEMYFDLETGELYEFQNQVQVRKFFPVPQLDSKKPDPTYGKYMGWCSSDFKLMQTTYPMALYPNAMALILHEYYAASLVSAIDGMPAATKLLDVPFETTPVKVDLLYYKGTIPSYMALFPTSSQLFVSNEIEARFAPTVPDFLAGLKGHYFIESDYSANTNLYLDLQTGDLYYKGTSDLSSTNIKYVAGDHTPANKEKYVECLTNMINSANKIVNGTYTDHEKFQAKQVVDYLSKYRADYDSMTGVVPSASCSVLASFFALNNGRLSLRLETPAQIKVNVCDISGRLVAPAINRVMTAGYQSIDLGVSNLARGSYLVQVSKNGQSSAQKMMVK